MLWACIEHNFERRRKKYPCTLNHTQAKVKRWYSTEKRQFQKIAMGNKSMNWTYVSFALYSIRLYIIFHVISSLKEHYFLLFVAHFYFPSVMFVHVFIWNEHCLIRTCNKLRISFDTRYTPPCHPHTPPRFIADPAAINDS